MSNRRKFTILAMVMLIVYCIVVLILAAFGKGVSDVLTTCWFSAWTVELGLLFGIKIKGGKKDE